jgi:PleD family two-component response regulator
MASNAGSPFFNSALTVQSLKEINVRVLLVEDDSETAQSIELMLKTEGINVYRTDLGEE